MSKPFHITFLAEELRRRKLKNRRYSLRAFATFIDTHPSALSRILAGKQEMSVAIALQIIQKLKLSPEDQERFVFSVAQERYKQTLSTLSEGAQIDHLSAALRQSEERYRKLINAVDQAVSIQELIRDENGKVVDTRFLRVNPKWEATTGINQTTAVESTFLKLFPQTSSEMLALYDRTHRLQTAQRQEVYYVERDQYVDCLIVPLEDNRFMETGVNTTERRRHLERQSYLLGLNEILRDLADPLEIQFQASRYLGEYLKCTNVGYAEYNQEQTSRTVHRDYVAPGGTSISGTYEIAAFQVSMDTARREPVVITDTQIDAALGEGERNGYAAASIGAIVTYALLKGGKYVAALSVANATPRKWAFLEVELVKETADLTWSAVQRALAEAALLRQRRFLDATLSSLPDTVYAIDRERKFAYANQTFQDVIGLDRNQIIGKTLEELGYSPASVALFNRQLDTVFAEGRTVQDEYQETSPKGKTGIYHYILGPVRGENGAVEQVVGILRETTERHALEQKLRQNEALLSLVFDTLPLPIGIVDKQGDLILSNRAMGKYLPTARIPSKDPSQTQRWKSFLGDGTLMPSNEFPAVKALRGEEYRDRLEMFFVQDDGSETRVWVTSRAVRDSEGAITGAFVFVELASESQV